MPDLTQDMRQAPRVLVGAMLGGMVGYCACLWLVGQGFYGIILPGAGLGLGASLGRSKSVPLAAACGLAALGLGLFTDWRLEPFIADRSFLYYFSHVPELQPITVMIIALGGALGFWFPFRRGRKAQR